MSSIQRKWSMQPKYSHCCPVGSPVRSTQLAGNHKQEEAATNTLDYESLENDTTNGSADC